MSSNKAGYSQLPVYAPDSEYQPQTGYPHQTGYPPQTGYSPEAGVYGQNTSSVIMTQPGGAGVTYSYARPPDYLAASILACLCCFWPTGLCAIYFASQSNSAVARGDMEEATHLSNNARNLMISSIVLGVIVITLYVVLRFVVFTGNNNHGF